MTNLLTPINYQHYLYAICYDLWKWRTTGSLQLTVVRVLNLVSISISLSFSISTCTWGTNSSVKPLNLKLSVIIRNPYCYCTLMLQLQPTWIIVLRTEGDRYYRTHTLYFILRMQGRKGIEICLKNLGSYSIWRLRHSIKTNIQDTGSMRQVWFQSIFPQRSFCCCLLLQFI